MASRRRRSARPRPPSSSSPAACLTPHSLSALVSSRLAALVCAWVDGGGEERPAAFEIRMDQLWRRAACVPDTTFFSCVCPRLVLFLGGGDPAMTTVPASFAARLAGRTALWAATLGRNGFKLESPSSFELFFSSTSIIPVLCNGSTPPSSASPPPPAATFRAPTPRRPASPARAVHSTTLLVSSRSSWTSSLFPSPPRSAS